MIRKAEHSVLKLEQAPSLRYRRAYVTSECSFKKENQLWLASVNYVANTPL